MTTMATTRVKVSLDGRELAAVLTGLRLLQENEAPEGGRSLPGRLRAICTNDGAFEPIAPAEIDELCERLNCGDPAQEEEAPEDLQRILDAAEDDEQGFILDAAVRAGVLWACPCGSWCDGEETACQCCGSPRGAPEDEADGDEDDQDEAAEQKEEEEE